MQKFKGCYCEWEMQFINEGLLEGYVYTPSIMLDIYIYPV